MAGYLSNRDSWKSFEAVARPYLESYGVDCLHAMNFHNSKGCFKGWDITKKITFLEGLIQLFRPRVILGVTAATYKKEHKVRKLETGLSNNQSPFGFCFTLVLNLLPKDEGVQKCFKRGGDLSFVIEDSPQKNQGVLLSYEGIKKTHNLEKAKSMIFAGKNSSVAIQMADMIAFYSRRHVTAMDRNNQQPVEMDPMLNILTSGIKHIGRAATDFFP